MWADGQSMLQLHQQWQAALAGMAFPAVAGVAAPITKDCSGRNLKCTRVDVHMEEQELSRENNEAIVVGAVGSGAPWFLTGWAEGTEVENLRTGQVWADGQSMLQLHQQQQAARASAHLTSSLVLPPDSEIMAPVSIRFPSGIQPGRFSLIEPKIAITASYGVLVGCTLVNASEWPASVLLY